MCVDVDIFQERFELILGHIGYVGHSFGASLGGVIAGVEHRITAYVLMAGAAQATQIMRTWQHPLIAKARENTPPEAWEAMLVAEAPYDACHYIGQASPAVLLFQFARHDDFVPVQEAESYFELASEPKRIAWYENCHHELVKRPGLIAPPFSASSWVYLIPLNIFSICWSGSLLRRQSVTQPKGERKTVSLGLRMREPSRCSAPVG